MAAVWRTIRGMFMLQPDRSTCTNEEASFVTDEADDGVIIHVKLI